MENFLFDSDVKNDRIDLDGPIDIRMKKLSTELDTFRYNLKGKTMDVSVSNAIRRTILQLIPIYGFNRKNIFIEHEKCKYMYNNDLIYNQIETLPIYNIANYFDLEDPETFLPEETQHAVFGNFSQERIPSRTETQENDERKKIFNIELMLNVLNETNDNMFVTTHQAVLKIDNKISNSYKKHKAISIIVLKPGEEIHLRAVANLNISLEDAAYEATTNVVSKEISTSEYEIIYETLNQLPTDIIFTKACTIMSKKLEKLQKYIEDEYSHPEIDSNGHIEIQLYGETHTLGFLLSRALQKCDLVDKAGYYLPSPFINNVVIHYVTSKKNPIQVCIKVIKYLRRLFDHILNVAFVAANK